MRTQVRLNVTLKARGGAASPECEVVVSGDLRDGQRKNVRAAYGTIAATTTGIGAGAFVIAFKAMGLPAMAFPVTGGVAALTAAGAMLGYRAVFRRALRKAREELDKMLLDIQRNLDSQALFGELPPPPVLPRQSDDGSATVIAAIASIG